MAKGSYMHRPVQEDSERVECAVWNCGGHLQTDLSENIQLHRIWTVTDVYKFTQKWNVFHKSVKKLNFH